MGSVSIPKEVKAQMEERVRRFNRETLGGGEVYYVPRFRGRYLYLDRYEFGRQGPICRLTYTSEMDKWEFAIFKWSSERYDPDEWMFPGAEHLDGTVEGAMKAGLEAYPA